jgi:hypothetical protein
MADEILIGFDAREAGEHDSRWDDKRRERFLLRGDVARPLSVDRLAWPTIFDVWYSDRNRGFARSLSEEERERFGRGSIPVPDWGPGANAPLWGNLDRMKAYLDEQGADPVDRVLVAVGWLSRLGFRETGNVGPYPKGPYLVPAEPAQPERSWNLLGYDVADGGRISGLSNCGYTAGESERLCEEWAPKLNEHHLFRDREAGFAFVDVANVRVPEHAPFHVYSLYSVR